MKTKRKAAVSSTVGRLVRFIGWRTALAAYRRRLTHYNGCWRCGANIYETKMFGKWRLCPICASTRNKWIKSNAESEASE